MKPGQYSPLLRALLASATSKLNLSVGGGAVLLALGAQTTGVGGQTFAMVTLGLGVLAYGAMIGMDATNPEFIRHHNQVRVATEESLGQILPPAAVTDAEIRKVYAGILAALEKCETVYDAGTEGLRSSLEDGMRRARELVAVASRAAARSNAIHRHLGADSPAALASELRELHGLAEATGDETAKRDFAQAAEAKTKELETYRQLQGLHDRIHAQLKLIETSLDGLSAKLVKLDATDLAEAISLNESLTENLQTMTSDVEILESTYEETIQELRV